MIGDTISSLTQALGLMLSKKRAGENNGASTLLSPKLQVHDLHLNAKPITLSNSRKHNMVRRSSGPATFHRHLLYPWTVFARDSLCSRPSVIGQSAIQGCQCDRSLQRHATFHDVLRKGGMKHYITQFGYSFIFNLYTTVCGVTINEHEETIYFEWNLIKDYLSDEYHHYDAITSASNSCKAGSKLCIVKIVIRLAEEELDTEFESWRRKQNLDSFAKMVCRIVPKPRYGEQLMCYVKGDEYVTGRLKHYFIQPVFRQGGVVLGSRRHEDLQMRLDSCRRLQSGFDASIDAFSLQLAEAGYFLTTDNSLAQCYECGGILQLKDFNFDPWEDHAYWHPSCPYLLAQKGREFIENVRKELKKKCNFSRECMFTFKIRVLAAAQPEYNDASSSEDETDDENDYESDMDSVDWDPNDYSSDSGYDNEEEDDFFM